MVSKILKSPNFEDSSIKDDEQRKYRIISILSYFIVLVVLGVPIWWYTTRVYRASLPINEINDLKTIEQLTRKEFGIPLSLNYDILISFVHPDPENLKIHTRVKEIDFYLANVLEKLQPIADFTVKSQWLFQTELGAIPRKILDHFGILESQLPHIITPLETKLWSHVSEKSSINFVIYFPHCKSPLYIYNDQNEMSTTNTFISPGWGGVYIMNPDRNSCKSLIFEADSLKISSVIQQMLLELFGLKNITDNESLEEFKSNKITEMLESSKRTLKSLAQLLSEINSIVISDQVADQINLALESVKKAESGPKNTSLKYAKLAFQNSEEAFAHPSLLALLYFPDDQKYAIYIPLFLPVMIPVIISLIHLRKKVETINKEKIE